MGTENKHHFSEVMADLMYNAERIKAKKSSPLLVSLHEVMEERRGAQNEPIPSGELSRALKTNERLLSYLASQGKV